MKKIVLLFAAAAAIAACTKEAEKTNGAKELVSMSFTTIGDPITRSSLNENFGIVWSSDDKISVFSGSGTNTTFEVESLSQNGSVATFRGLAEVSPEYYALFPAQEAASISGGVISATLSPDQQAVKDSFGPSANLSVGKVEASEELQLKNVGAILGVQLQAGSGATGIRLESIGGESLSGSAAISYNNGEPEANISSGNDYVQLTSASALEEGTYYFVVYPGSYAQGFRIIFTKPGYSATMTSGKALTLARNDNVSLTKSPVSIPAEAWLADFTDGEKLFIRNSAEAGQQLTHVDASYRNMSVAGAGDTAAFENDDFTYEIFTRLEARVPFYFESENGAMFAPVVDGGLKLKRIGAATNAQFTAAVEGVYRIRINPVSGTAYMFRIDQVRISFNYTSEFQMLTYEGNGIWGKENAPVRWGVWEYNANETRYYFSIWFNKDYAGNNYDKWQRYGEYGAYFNDDPNDFYTNHLSVYDESDYYYVQPFKGDQDNGYNDWNLCFYLHPDLWDSTFNGRYSAHIQLKLNADGHYTHCFAAPIVDNKSALEGELTIEGSGSEGGQTVNNVIAATFAGPSDQFGQTAGSDYDYEVFTHLNANLPFYFKCGSRLFSIDNGSVVAISSTADATYTVPDDGEYRIRLKMPAGAAYIDRITSAVFKLCPMNGDNPYDEGTLVYDAEGKWVMQNHALKWQVVDWSWDHYKDTRYKLWFTFKTSSGQTVTQAYGNNGDGGLYEAGSGTHMNLQPVNSSQWDNAWKIPYSVTENKNSGEALTNLEVFMNFDLDSAHYTQRWTSAD